MLSLVVSLDINSNKSNKECITYIDKILSTFNDVEVILVIDYSKHNEVFEKIKELKIKYPINLKILFPIKQLQFKNIISQSIRISTKNYICFINSNNLISLKQIKSILKIYSKSEKVIDILEIIPSFEGIIKWKPLIRGEIKVSTTLQIDKWEKIIAYSFPILENKIFSKNLFKNNFIKNYFENYNDSLYEYSIILVYYLFFYAKTYFLIANDYFEIKLTNYNVVNYKSIFNEWDKILNLYTNNKKYVNEIRYACYFYLNFFFCALISSKKINYLNNFPKEIAKNYEQKLRKYMLNNFNNFYLDNPFMISEKSEIKHLGSQPLPISKWSKILTLIK